MPTARNPQQLTGYLLAGGRSQRMGRDKALLEVDGELLLEHGLTKLKTVCSEAKILSGPRDNERDAILARYAPLVPDAQQGHAGPLAGLASALADCRTPYALLLAIDQPGVTADLLRHLAEAAFAEAAPAACFSATGTPEPLPLLISCDLAEAVQRALLAGERRLLPTVQACARQLGREMLHISLNGDTGRAFTNLNNPGDLLAWQDTQTSNQSAPGASEPSNG